MNYFKCKVCGNLCDLDSNFCDVYHQRYWIDYQEAFAKWLERGVPLLDHVELQEWEFNFQPPHMGGLMP